MPFLSWALPAPEPAWPPPPPRGPPPAEDKPWHEAVGAQVAESPFKLLWATLSFIGLRNMKSLLPSCYSTTTFYFDGIGDRVVLTIDDGLCRNGKEASLVRPQKK